jgi:cytoskeletal protein CcmA (bactofilin family)
MEPEKDNPPAAGNEPPKQESQAPADALSRTPEDLEEEATKQAEASGETKTDADKSGEKKISPIKKFFRKVNIYFVGLGLLVAVSGAIAIVNYLNSQKPPADPNIANQSLTQDALKQLANTDATVGNTSQTLTIQGNAVIAGQTLARGNLNVAGNFQSGGSIQGPSITIAGNANLGATQLNSLQVATTTAIQGSTTMRDLNVSGASTFSGAMTASQITVTKLILSGNALLEVPNHISFTGPGPSRTVTSALGNGGSASVNGSDTAGTVNLNSGAGTSAGCLVTIKFAQRFEKQPRVIISPVGSAAGALEYYVNRSATEFSICTNTAAQTNKSFGFDYFVTN